MDPVLPLIKLWLDIQVALFLLMDSTVMVDTHEQASVWSCLQFSDAGEAEDASRGTHGCSVFHLL